MSNRPKRNIQKVNYGGMDESHVSTKMDPTFNGPRVYGDSNKLARARYNLKQGPKPDFQTWRKHREAQHLVPASVAKRYKMSETLLDSARNGMMLPAYPGVTQTVQMKPYHRRTAKHRDHPYYSRNTSAFIKRITKKGGKLNSSTWGDVMDTLREAHKGGGINLVDDISTKRMTSVWNTRKHSPKL